MESYATLHDRHEARRSGDLLPLALAALLLLAPGARLRAQVAVIVNSANPADDISLDRLKRLFLGQTTTFATGGHARLAMATGSSEQFDERALGLQRESVRARWMAMTFRGEATTLPAEFATAEDVKRFVREHPDAIAYLPAAEVDGSVKVLRIDGKRPSDAGYAVR